MIDKIEEIRARHKDATWRYYELPSQMHDDRAFLLAEVERLTGKYKLVADALNDTISKYHEVGNQVDRLDAEMQIAKANAWDEGYQDHQAMIDGIVRKPSNPYR